MYPSSGQFQISKNIQRYKSIWRCLKVEQFKYLPQSGQRGRKVHELELWRPPLGISLGPVASQSLKYSTSTREEAFQFVFLVQKVLLLESLNVSHHHHCQWILSPDWWILRIPSSVG